VFWNSKKPTKVHDFRRVYPDRAYEVVSGEFWNDILVLALWGEQVEEKDFLILAQRGNPVGCRYQVERVTESDRDGLPILHVKAKHAPRSSRETAEMIDSFTWMGFQRGRNAGRAASKA
jgi:hypothetical protein